jgi:hypothetical protein
MASLESAKKPMSAVEIDDSLIRALQARARKEKTTVDRLVRRLIAESLQELEDHEAVKAYRARPGRTLPLAGVKKRLGLDRPARRRG